MGRRGPPATPTVLTIARGNPGKRAINTDEPQLPAADPVAMPTGLPKRAKAEWSRLASDLVTSGVLSVGDLATFEQYVRLVADVEEYEKLIKKVGRTDAHKLGYCGYLLKLRSQLKQFAAELGLTPASRSGVKRIKAKDPKDAKRDRFFGGAKSGENARDAG